MKTNRLPFIPTAGSASITAGTSPIAGERSRPTHRLPPLAGIGKSIQTSWIKLKLRPRLALNKGPNEKGKSEALTVAEVLLVDPYQTPA